VAPVGVNSFLLIFAAAAHHRATKHSCLHHARPALLPLSFDSDGVDQNPTICGEAVDISRDD